MNRYKSVIQDLFDNMTTIGEVIQPDNESIKELRETQIKISGEFKETLSDEQSVMHEEYMKTYYDMSNQEVYKAYLQGIYLGLRLMAESFYHSEL